MANRYLSAAKENFNVLGLVSTVALSAALLDPIPLLAGLVLEAAFLLFVPDSSWYVARLARRHDEEVRARREALKAEILPTLRPSLQERFARLEQSRIEIDTLVKGETDWMREVLRKLDYLAEKFLQFASKDEQFRAYLLDTRKELERSRRLGPGAALIKPDSQALSDEWVKETVTFLESAYSAEMVRLESEKAEQKDESTLAIIAKRLDVLRRRQEFAGKTGAIIGNLSHQLALLEDTFGLISDELLARPPEQVLSDIDDVVSQSNALSKVLEEIAPYEKMVATLTAT